jgi:hypothetical protein
MKQQAKAGQAALQLSCAIICSSMRQAAAAVVAEKAVASVFLALMQ